MLTLYTATTDSIVLALLEIETIYNFAFSTIVTDAGKNVLSQNINFNIYDLLSQPSSDQRLERDRQRLFKSLQVINLPQSGQFANYSESIVLRIRMYFHMAMNEQLNHKLPILDFQSYNLLIKRLQKEVNSIPLVKHESYLFLAPQDLITPPVKLQHQSTPMENIAIAFPQLEIYLKKTIELRNAILFYKITDRASKTNESFKHGKHVASIGDVVIVERSRFREGLYGVIEQLPSSTSAIVRTRLGSETQKLACLVPIVMQPENSNEDSPSSSAQPNNL